jgi:LmbE family N-acetylglucosaminyl deacetylase
MLSLGCVEICGKNRRMPKWIYLSPHLDDVAISCGGLVWEQTQAGVPVEIWTICAGDPPDGPLSPFAQALHARWQTGREAVAIRRKEDQRACLEIGAAWRHFAIPDCIYRTDEQGLPLVAGEQALFGDLQAADLQRVGSIRQSLAGLLAEGDRLVSPLAIGNHIDHQLTRAAAEASERRLWYYADYPYAQARLEQCERLLQAGWRAEVFPLSAEAMLAWLNAVAAHQSQFSSFWQDMGALRAALENYQEQMGGVRLWQPPSNDLPA